LFLLANVFQVQTFFSMGCSDNTKQALIDASGDLLAALLQSAADLLSGALAADQGIVPLSNGTDPRLKTQVGASNSDNAELLQSDLQQLTERQFLTKYAYSYNGPRTVPLDLAPNGRVVGSEDFVSVAAGNTAAMTQYVDNTVLGAGSGLPTWFTGRFTGDLLNTMTVLLEKGNSDWQYETFTNQYTDPSGVQSPISVAAIMTYATAKLTEGGQSANSSIIYYTAVYYNSVGWGAVQQRKALMDSALQGQLGAPLVQNVYNVIKYTVTAGSAVVADCIGTYIVSLPPPSVKVVSNVVNSTVQININLQNNSADPQPAGAPNPTQWVETALHNCGFTNWSRTEQQADANTSAKLAFLWTYTEQNSVGS